MAIKVLVNGAFGRMGQHVVKTLEEDARFQLVGQTGREYHLDKAIKDSHPDVVIDFTEPKSVYRNTETIIDAGARPVIGTSGLSETDIQTLQKKCADLKRGGIIVPNFSLGAVLLMKYAKEISKFMPNVEIIEMHHDKKLDSPSGSALRTADLLAGTGKLNPALQSTVENVKGARGAFYKNIPIHAVRLPGLLAHLQVIFGGTGETLTLRHDSLDRSSFMPGVLLACEKVMTLNGLVCGLEEVL